MPNDPVAAVKLLANGIAAADIRPVGLGHVNGRYFCFHTGIGYDAAVVKEVEGRASIKRWAGHPLFIYAAVRTWATSYDRTEPHFRLTFDPATTGQGADVIPDGFFTIVLNTNPYTYLGNRALDLSPAATLDRPLVAVTFRTVKVGAILSTLMGALRGGGVKPGRYVDEHTNVRHLVVEHEQPFPYQVDGDYLGETPRLEFTHEPDAVHDLLRRRGRVTGAEDRDRGTARDQAGRHGLEVPLGATALGVAGVAPAEEHHVPAPEVVELVHPAHGRAPR
jgi:diacylglycerol kinase family enzyme